MTTTHENRTLVVDFMDYDRYQKLIMNGHAFVEFITRFILELSFKLHHKPDCCGGCDLTRHSHYTRKRIGNLVIWRVQCKHCKAVFTVLPHFVLRYQSMPVAIARQSLFALYGGLSLEWTALLFGVNAMAVYRLICGFGSAPMVRVLMHCGLSLPEYILVDEKFSQCVGEKVYLPTVTSGRVIWLLTLCQDKTARAFTEGYGEFAQAALSTQADYSPKGLTCDGFDSTRQALHKHFPHTPIANCLYHAASSLRRKLKTVEEALRNQLVSAFWKLFDTSQASKLIPVFGLGQKLRRFHEEVSQRAGKELGLAVKEWIGRKKQGWFEWVRHPLMPSTTTLLDQAHNAINRKLFAMKGFHQDSRHQKQYLNGFALLYNFVPYQRRAKNAGQCGVQVEKGHLPRDDWFLSLQILTAGGFR
jgi:hypothetical protein